MKLTMFYVAKIHDCGALLQAEMRPPLFRKMLRPIGLTSAWSLSILPLKDILLPGSIFLREDRTDDG